MEDDIAALVRFLKLVLAVRTISLVMSRWSTMALECVKLDVSSALALRDIS